MQFYISEKSHLNDLMIKGINFSNSSFFLLARIKKVLQRDLVSDNKQKNAHLL